jgi:hypothetical protein
VRVTKGGKQEAEPAVPSEVLGAGFQKELSHHRRNHRAQQQGQRLCLHH